MDSDGLMTGSIPWMAPELLKGAAPRRGQDIWSLGITVIGRSEYVSVRVCVCVCVCVCVIVCAGARTQVAGLASVLA